MGEQPGLGFNFLHPDEVGRTDYKVIPGGSVVPHRIDDNGRSPAFDKDTFLKNITVNIIDDGVVTSLKPGEADEFGNPKPKDPPCSSPLLSTSGTPAPSLAPSPPSGAAAASPSSPPGSHGTGTSTPTGNSSSPKKRGKQSQQQDPEMISLLLQVSQRLSSLESKQSSPTSSLGPPSIPDSKKPSGASESGHPLGHKIRLESALGSMTFEALDVRLDTQGLLVLVLDPLKPRFLPKAGLEILVVVDEAEAYNCSANDLVVRVGRGASEVLVVLLVLLGTPGAPE